MSVITTSSAWGASGSAYLVSGWYKFTTLTATRCLWSSGTTFCSQIAATTSELTMGSDGATTDSVWTTSGLGLTTGKWWHISWLASCAQTGTGEAWRVWIADAEHPPTEVTVTLTTAIVGAFTSSTTLVLGNRTTAGALAIQGSMSSFMAIAQGAGNSSVASLPMTAFGAITQVEADQVRERLLVPLWQGNPDWRFSLLRAAGVDRLIYVPLTLETGTSSYSYYTRAYGVSDTTPQGVMTFRAGTASGEQPPTRLNPNWPLRRYIRRR